MMAGPSNDKCISSVDCGNDPPPLNITLKKTRDLPKKVKHWSRDHLPVDILLLTVENCEFLACYHYLRDPFRSYEQSIGNVYFGKMGEDEGSVKVAIVRCFEESSYPGGSQTATKNAVTLLKPKATFLVGFCYSPRTGKAQLGDVVISSKLTTDCHKTPVSRDFGNLVRSAAYGWKAPLENPEAREVKVHCDGEILSCSDLIGAEQQCQSHPGAIAVEMEGKGENYSHGYSCFTFVIIVKKIVLP